MSAVLTALVSLVSLLFSMGIPVLIFLLFYKVISKSRKEIALYEVMVNNLSDKTVQDYTEYLSKIVALPNSCANWERSRQAWCIVNESPNVSTAVMTK